MLTTYYGPEKIIASDAAADDQFGVSVSVSGDTAVIGAAGDNGYAGSAYVFVNSNGVWAQQAKLVASDAAADDYFGEAVAIHGDTAVIGAWLDDHAGGANAGSAYVFIRSAGVWTQQAKLTASDAAASDRFGEAVAIHGDTAVIGAPSDNHAGGANAGSAYVFIRSAGVWTQQAKLTAQDAAASDNFGRSVSVSGDTAVIGAFYDDHAGKTDAGSAYVFVRSGGVWTQQAKLTAQDAADTDYFGISASVYDDTAVIGAYYDDHAGGANAGSAYVFVRSGGVWTQQAKLTASDAAADDYFGVSVSVSGDTAVVGAWNDDHAGWSDAGSAYVFIRSAGVWTQQAKLTASDAANTDVFGYSVSVSGDTIVVGAWLDTHAGGFNAGSAYVYIIMSSPSTPQSITPEIITILIKKLPSPHIITPEENEQFNVGIVQVSWEHPAPIAYIDLSDETQFQYVWNSGAGDVGQAEWLDIRNNLEDAAYGNAYGGRDFVYEMFLNPNSKVRVGDVDGKATYPNGEVSIDLGDDFDVIDIHPIYDSPAPSYPGSLEPFTFRVVNNTDGKQYKAFSDDTTYNINIILERQSKPMNESYLIYELEYTDDYNTENTTWSAVNKRIPWNTTSYSWAVGKMIKSRKARIRMRTKDILSEYISDWTLSNLFTINVYKLAAPAIVSPVSNILYSDFVQIILDESQLINTYNQKVRYTLDYSSQKQNINWTIIAKDIPVGQNIIRWNLDSVPSSDDYSLRITAQNVSTSCAEMPTIPDQIARTFVHNIQIQQSGLFIIDTRPPQAVLEINNNTNITNQLNQILNIFAEDESTSVKQIQLRECDVGNALLLGEINTYTEPPAAGEDPCPSPISLIETRDFNTLITDSPIGNLSKIQWTFDALDAEGNPISAIKKIEALLTDMGGNTSLQERTKVFLSVFNNSNNTINDFIIVIEQRDKTTFDGTTADHVSAVYEVAYAGTSTGQLWVLEPYSRFIYTIDDHPNISKLLEFNDAIYIGAYNATTDIGAIYRHDSSEATMLKAFPSGLSNISGMCEFDASMYIGLQNGNLWEFNGFAFSNIQSFNEPIKTVYGDNKYLYIGFYNSSHIVVYDGSSFTTLDAE